MKNVNQRLSEIERTLYSNKRILTFKEGASYLNLSESYLYKLTHLRRIPFSKPNGKKIFFDRVQLDIWLMQNPVMTTEQLECAASTHVSNNMK